MRRTLDDLKWQIYEIIHADEIDEIEEINKRKIAESKTRIESLRGKQTKQKGIKNG